MSNPEILELIKHVDELIAATRNGLFQWTAVNPTTQVWERPPQRDSPAARMTLQRVEQSFVEKSLTGQYRTARRPLFILQVFEIRLVGERPVMRLNISGADDPALNSRLEELFRVIATDSSEQGIDFLKSLIPKN